MRKVIVAINITLDGFCDHTVGIADDELHNFYNKIMEGIDLTMMGRITYQLMEDHWPNVAETRIGAESEIEFADHFERIEKIVISTTLKEVALKRTRIIEDNIINELEKLKQEPGMDILIGGPSLISYLTENNRIDEFYFVIHPFILGNGTRLFQPTINQVDLEFIDSKTFESGVIATHYRVKS